MVGLFLFGIGRVILRQIELAIIAKGRATVCMCCHAGAAEGKERTAVKCG